MRRPLSLSLIVAVTAVVLAAAAASAGARPTAKEPIVIGIATAQTGFIAAFDKPAVSGAMIAVDDINKAGGVLGRPLKVVTADTKSDINLGAQAGLSVISKGADVMLVTLDFNFGGPAARVAQSKGMVAMSIGASSPKFGVSGIGPLAYTIGSNGDVEAYAEAEWAYQKKHWRTAYLLLDDTTDAEPDAVQLFRDAVEGARRDDRRPGHVQEHRPVRRAADHAPEGALEGTRRDRALLVPAGRRRRDPADPPAGDRHADHR